MTVRKLTEDGDIIFGKGSYTFEKDSPEAVAIVLRERFLLSLGNWWLNQNAGFNVFLGIEDKEYIDGVVRDYIENTEGVSSIVSFQSEQDMEKRLYKAQVEVTTDYGNLQTEVVL